jgi:hypothetical protein
MSWLLLELQELNLEGWDKRILIPGIILFLYAMAWAMRRDIEVKDAKMKAEAKALYEIDEEFKNLQENENDK